MTTCRDTPGKATELRDYAADLFRGEFHALPELRRRAEENSKKRHRELFGSES